MHLQKLITHMRQLNREQLNRLGDFVHSPYFKVPVSAVMLFDYLEKLYPDYEERKIQPALIAKKAKDLPAANKQAKAGTELLKAIERFLAVERLCGNERNMVMETLWEENALQWNALYDDNIVKMQALLAEDEQRDIKYFYDRHVLVSVENQGFRRKIDRGTLMDVQEVVTTLDEFYAIKKLRYHCELLSRHKLFGFSYKVENLPQLIDWLEPFNNEKYPYVYLFVNVYKMLVAESFKETGNHFNLLKSYLNASQSKSLNQAAKECLDYMDAAGTYWYNLGYMEGCSWMLWCIQVKMKHNRLLHQGKIAPQLFRNTITAAIIVGTDAAWIKQFISTYSSCLPEANAETTMAFVSAQYHHYTGEFKEALRLYQQAQVKEEPLINAVTRRWQFMCMYEQNSENKQVLLDFLAAYEKYVKRNAGALGKYEKMFLLLIGYLRQLVLETSKNDRAKVAAALQTENYFTGKPWLLTQLQK